MPFQIKRIYLPAQPADGRRILVDRLWPRGISKERAALADWMKDIAPSPELRTWFGHQPERFNEFARRYTDELQLDPAKQAAAATLRGLAANGMVTLLFAAHDPAINHAIVLQAFLQGQGIPQIG